ncbi:NAD(P)/FAD-dependent oxidoreductase [Haloechinothrix halophila]|uniref:NAD(P)/FAD-dependent oxidoreductase n=1 Tax=Haloechinothrix halophila TaxID=1069073 RepID=UPI0003FB2FCB|nr:FAD-dependent oxidoreductase [Haloechinothrix halophila]
MTASAGTTVIVGCGQAGTQVAASLRRDGYPGRIVLVGDEPELPYQRPPLSKSFLLDQKGEDALRLRPEAYYRDNDINLLIGERVLEIDRSRRRVRIANGTEYHWDHLVLATGARPRRLGIPGEDLDGVTPLRGVADARRLRTQLIGSRRVVIIGGGFIGLELAASAVAAGNEVVLLEATERVMGRAVTGTVSSFFAAAHTNRGVNIELRTAAAEFVGKAGRVSAVRDTEGRTHPADLVVVGVGVLPNTELAEGAGLASDDGVLVDSSLRTTDPQVYAIGDCARFPNVHTQTLTRLESVQNASDQASHVARQITTGKLAAYRELPWFWSDQKGLKLQIAGLTCHHNRLHLLGEPDDGRFSVLAFRDDQLVAVESVNRPSDHMAARRLLCSGRTPSPSDAARPGFDLKSFASAIPGVAA